MRRLTRTAGLLLSTVLALATPAAAGEVVAEWNICAQTIIAAGRASILYGAGPATQLDLASVHLAMHDAVQAYDHRYETYAGPIAGGQGSAAAAAARAAQSLLLQLMPAAQKPAIDACYAGSMIDILPTLTPEQLIDSNAVGDLAANNVLLSRKDDGSFPANPTAFTGGTAAGQWRPNPNTASMVAPWLADVRPMAIDGLYRCEPDDLPAMTSGEYADAFNEVKSVGAINSTTRTAEQSHIGKIFSGNFAGQFNRLMRELAAAYIPAADVKSLGERARLFALANTASADAIICSWHAKRSLYFWRPYQAIRNAGADGNGLTDEDATWTPYMATPNYPDYTSGGNNFGAAMTRTFALFFGSDKPFHGRFRIYWLGGAVPLQQGDASYREYAKFSDIEKDIVDARIYLGIHFRFADTEARSQGRRVAQATFHNILNPIRE